MAWYVSLTLRWADLAGDGKDPFLNWCDVQPVRWNHLRMHRNSLHSTIYAFAKIDAVNGNSKMHDAARAAFDVLRHAELLESLQGFAIRPFEIVPSELRYYNDSTSVQFRGIGACNLKGIRDKINETVQRINFPANAVPGAVQFPFNDPTKNTGERLFGAIGRAAIPGFDNPLQQVSTLDGRVCGVTEGTPLVVNKLILTVSDDALTNPLVGDDFRVINLQ